MRGMGNMQGMMKKMQKGIIVLYHYVYMGEFEKVN